MIEASHINESQHLALDIRDEARAVSKLVWIEGMKLLNGKELDLIVSSNPSDAEILIRKVKKDKDTGDDIDLEIQRKKTDDVGNPSGKLAYINELFAFHLDNGGYVMKVTKSTSCASVQEVEVEELRELLGTLKLSRSVDNI